LAVVLSTAASALVATPVSAVPPRSKTPSATATGLDRPGRKEIAKKLVSSAENCTLTWRKQTATSRDIDDGRGYTGGIIGFRSVPALRKVNGTDSHEGLGRPFVRAWHRAGDSEVR
jgi:chitosanase